MGFSRDVSRGNGKWKWEVRNEEMKNVKRGKENEEWGIGNGKRGREMRKYFCSLEAGLNVSR